MKILNPFYLMLLLFVVGCQENSDIEEQAAGKIDGNGIKMSNRKVIIGNVLVASELI